MRVRLPLHLLFSPVLVCINLGLLLDDLVTGLGSLDARVDLADAGPFAGRPRSKPGAAMHPRRPAVRPGRPRRQARHIDRRVHADQGEHAAPAAGGARVLLPERIAVSFTVRWAEQLRVRQVQVGTERLCERAYDFRAVP